jgi:protein-L-isoaspartate(D-aspartate) O-methyltransferase
VTADDLSQFTIALADRLARGHPGGALSSRLRDAFASVPRHRFLPRYIGARGASREDLDAAELSLSSGVAHEIYSDTALALCRNDFAARSTSSAPGVMWAMLEMLRPEPGARVLEIGSGSGYNAAILGRLVGPAGRVETVEVVRGAADDAEGCLGAHGLRNVSVHCADGTAGWPREAPYDGVIVTGAARDLHPAWFDQLAEEGRLVAVLSTTLGQRLVGFTRRGGSLVGEVGLRVSFVPIVGGASGYPGMTAMSERLRHGWRGLRPPELSRFALGAEVARGVVWHQEDLLTLMDYSLGRRMVGEDEGPWASVFLCGDEAALSVARLVRGEGTATVHGDHRTAHEIGTLARHFSDLGCPVSEQLALWARPAGSTAPMPPAPIGRREFFEYSVA